MSQREEYTQFLMINCMDSQVERTGAAEYIYLEEDAGDNLQAAKAEFIEEKFNGFLIKTSAAFNDRNIPVPLLRRHLENFQDLELKSRDEFFYSKTIEEEDGDVGEMIFQARSEAISIFNNYSSSINYEKEQKFKSGPLFQSVIKESKVDIINVSKREFQRRWGPSANRPEAAANPDIFFENLLIVEEAQNRKYAKGYYFFKTIKEGDLEISKCIKTVEDMTSTIEDAQLNQRLYSFEIEFFNKLDRLYRDTIDQDRKIQIPFYKYSLKSADPDQFF